jgi:hypothetical protein
MAEVTGWLKREEEGGASCVFRLASEFDGSEEGRRQREQERRRLLASAGMVFPPTDGQQEGEGMALMGRGRVCPSYPRGTSSGGGNTGKTS